MTTVNAGWGAASNAPGWYETQTASNSGFTSPNPLYTVSSRAISYTLSSNHYFRVRACNILGCGSWNVSSLINVSQCI